jgi:hypothetical protein
VSTAARVLDRLERVKATGPSRWIAACPAHQDRSPSLSVRETDDGRLLLYDFGGCSIEDVLAAIGLQLADLFERPLEHFTRPTSSRIPARDLIELIGFEIDVAGILLAQIVEGRDCSEIAWQRLAQAAQRINRARSEIYGR